MNNNLGPAAGAHIHYQVPVAAVHPAGRVGSEAWVLGFAYWILLPAAKSLLHRKATNLTPALPVLAKVCTWPGEHTVPLLVLHEEGTRGLGGEACSWESLVLASALANVWEHRSPISSSLRPDPRVPLPHKALLATVFEHQWYTRFWTGQWWGVGKPWGWVWKIPAPALSHSISTNYSWDKCYVHVP